VWEEEALANTIAAFDAVTAEEARRRLTEEIGQRWADERQRQREEREAHYRERREAMERRWREAMEREQQHQGRGTDSPHRRAVPPGGAAGEGRRRRAARAAAFGHRPYAWRDGARNRSCDGGEATSGHDRRTHRRAVNRLRFR
jgi:hypothetical protein